MEPLNCYLNLYADEIALETLSWLESLSKIHQSFEAGERGEAKSYEIRIAYLKCGGDHKLDESY